MRKFALTVAALATALAGSAQAREKLTPQQRLDKILAGRVAGKPVSCISSWQARDMEVLDKTALVYRDGSTVYVNRPRNAEQLDSDDILVTYQTGSQLCRLDIVHTVDRTGFFMTGFVNLDDFVPYKRVARAD